MFLDSSIRRPSVGRDLSVCDIFLPTYLHKRKAAWRLTSMVFNFSNFPASSQSEDWIAREQSTTRYLPASILDILFWFSINLISVCCLWSHRSDRKAPTSVKSRQRLILFRLSEKKMMRDVSSVFIDGFIFVLGLSWQMYRGQNRTPWTAIKMPISCCTRLREGSLIGNVWTKQKKCNMICDNCFAIEATIDGSIDDWSLLMRAKCNYLV